ncbi:asparagine synthase (glutamine-hydrolyzing) [Nocardia beijingensis]
MCGITGWVSFASDLTRQQDVLDAMTETMARRGPDGGGTFVRAHVGLGHRRLAVIDAPGGAQPMTVSTPDGEVCLVYSGETYNFVELRKQLVACRHAFRTESDTEVVLRGYLQWGESLVDRLNGMYAFAIWDGRRQKLVMVRDRLGVKPLYYYPTPDGVLFGSEPKAILSNPLVRRIVDLDGLRELFVAARRPGWSLWKDMYEILPGTTLTVDRQGIHQRTYWRLAAKEHTHSQEDTVARVRELLTDIVGRQLVSDVGRCVLLSGGLDSSAITGLAAARLAGRGERLSTFSVDFANQEANFVPDEVRDTPDSPFIREVTQFADTAHRDIMLRPADLSDLSVRRAMVAARDSPLGRGEVDTSLYLLFQAIRDKATVALAGDSADEVFGGYRWFHDEAVLRVETFPWMAFGNTLTRAARWNFVHPALLERLDSRAYIADEYATAVAEVDHLAGEGEQERRMRTICHLHLSRFLRPLLHRTDRMSMAAGLEVRVPFCDHRLVEYVYNTPWSMKTFDGREKSLLRQATKHVLPRSVMDRVKSPYPSTQDPAYTANVQNMVKDILAEKGSPLFALIDRAWLQSAITQDPARMESHVRVGLERAIDLHIWLDLYSPDLYLD